MHLVETTTNTVSGALSRITEQNYKTIDSVSAKDVRLFFIFFDVNFPFHFSFYLYEEKALCLLAYFFLFASIVIT